MNGDFNLWSDIDVVVVSDELRGSPLERLRQISIPPGFEVIPVTLEELKRLLERRNPIAVELLENGVIVRDDYNIKELLGKKPS